MENNYQVTNVMKRSNAAVRRKSFSRKEKEIWVIKEKKIGAKGNNKKRPSLIQKKNEN